jgi:hypothetical protein
MRVARIERSEIRGGCAASRLFPDNALLLSGLRYCRPYPSGDLRAALAFDRRNIELALQIEPELGAVAEIAPKANGGIGRDRAAAVQNVRDPTGRHADVERQSVRAQAARSQLTLQKAAWVSHCVAFHGASLPFFVATGLDPVAHADLSAAWIAGSSPAMTI